MDRLTEDKASSGIPPCKTLSEDLRVKWAEGILVPLYLDWVKQGRPMRAVEGE